MRPGIFLRSLQAVSQRSVNGDLGAAVVGIMGMPPWDLSSPKPGHTTGGSGRGARPGGGAGPGKSGRRQNSSPKRHASLVPPMASKKRLLNVSPDARTSEILRKPNAGNKMSG